MKNINKKQNYKKGITTRTIDINGIYNNMKSVLSKRAYYQQQQKELWVVIKRYGSDKSREMDVIDEHIGKCSYDMNKLIGELCQYKKTHKAMNLAYDYLDREINRIKKIISSKNELIYEVRIGYTNLISSRGVTHSDPTNLINYVAKKEGQLRRLENWRNVVSKYREVGR